MRQRKLERCEKRQRGQFMTPKGLARDIVAILDLQNVRRILEPSCGDGSFVEAVLRRFRSEAERNLDGSQDRQIVDIVGVEIDSNLLNQCKATVALNDQSLE